jgi:hypothetical protein
MGETRRKRKEKLLRRHPAPFDLVFALCLTHLEI